MRYLVDCYVNAIGVNHGRHTLVFRTITREIYGGCALCEKFGTKNSKPCGCNNERRVTNEPAEEAANQPFNSKLVSRPILSLRVGFSQPLNEQRAKQLTRSKSGLTSGPHSFKQVCSAGYLVSVPSHVLPLALIMSASEL